MQIVDLKPGDEAAIRQAAALLVDGFPDFAWPTMAEALEEVGEVFEPGNFARLAIDAQGTVLGWIGGRSAYNGHVWELHPLVVHPEHQGQGVGRALVADLEDRVRARGGLTIQLGTDDHEHQTSLGQTDLYPNVWEHIARVQNLRRHPYEFYQKQGYVIVGVVPDANGIGKPDILMAKRVGSG
jgi:aminoglycoside 6'-N-acetyltransferase I